MTSVVIDPEVPFFQACDTLEEARDWALWLNFIHRHQPQAFGVVEGPERYSAVNQTMADELDTSFLQGLEQDYTKLAYGHLKHVAKAEEPAPFWEELTGLFTTVNGEILRFVLEHSLPLGMLVRLELANRGYDQNGNWCGFDHAESLWLNGQDQ